MTIHNYTQRNNTNALKGNLLQVNQVDLAKDLGVTQGRVSQMINNLLEEVGSTFRAKVTVTKNSYH